MIPPLPRNIGLNYVMVPVWQWEVKPGNDSAQCDKGPSISSQSQPAEGENTKSSCPPDLRLVFKGYQWRSVAHWEQIPYRGLERFSQDVQEAADHSQRLARERREAQAARLEDRERDHVASEADHTPKAGR